MTEAVTFEERDGHVVCRYSGPYAFPHAADAAHFIGERCASAGATRALVDIRRSQGDLSVAERYQIANEMAHRWERGIRLAVLGRPEQRLADRPWETAALKRGLSVRTFDDEASAIGWLLERDTASGANDERGSESASEV